MFFKKKNKKPRVPMMEQKTYILRFMHDFGHEMELKDVSEDSLNFIRENLGRDEIYVQDRVFINLKSYSWVTVETKHKNRPISEEPLEN
jgi:hypothetical protein